LSIGEMILTGECRFTRRWILTSNTLSTTNLT